MGGSVLGEMAKFTRRIGTAGHGTEIEHSTVRAYGSGYSRLIKKAMDLAISEWDADGDGVMDRPQFNTYDRVIYGHNTFVTSLYLAALQAAAEMAKLSRDENAAARYRKLLEKGRAKAAETLYDGEYYIQKADNLNLGYGKGCFRSIRWWGSGGPAC